VRIGVISDTHGTLRNEVFEHFEGVGHILHAGDIGDPDILVALATIAPVTAVCGNSDGVELQRIVPETATIEIADRTILVVHGHRLGSPTPAGLDLAHPGPDTIVFGHTHKPAFARIGGRLFLNPGSAGAPRFGMKPSIGILTIENRHDNFRLITL
jgi:hypothetical protein